MKRTILIIFALIAILVAGCAEVPTSGPVEQVGKVENKSDEPSVEIAPEPPVPGGSPKVILAGFLAAVNSTASNRLDVARQYLTLRAAETWDPQSGFTIYDPEGHPPLVTQNSAILQAPVVGRINSEGRFISKIERDFTHNFAMVKTGNEWRISNPGSGVFISRYSFERAYRSTPIHFLDRTGTRTVVENIYLPIKSQTPTAAIQALLRGPSAWLRPAVLTMVPVETRSSVTSVNVGSDGIATVSLETEIRSLSADQRVQLAAQVLWTLSSFPQIHGVKIFVDGALLSIRGQDNAGVLHIDDFANFHPQASDMVSSVVVIKEMAMKVDSQPGSAPQRLPGPFGGTETGAKVGTLGVSPDGSMIAAVTPDRTKLFTGPANASGKAVLRLEGKELSRPQIDRTGVVWVVEQSQESVPTMIRIAPDGGIIHTPLAELAGGNVVSFQVSPDLTRLAVSVRRSETMQVGLLRIRGSEQQVIDGWSPLSLTTGRGDVRDTLDVGWLNENRLMLLSSTTQDPHFSVYTTDIDGASVKAIGPISDVDAVSLAVYPRDGGVSAMLRTGSGRVLRYEDRSRWVQVAEGASAIGWIREA